MSFVKNTNLSRVCAGCLDFHGSDHESSAPSSILETATECTLRTLRPLTLNLTGRSDASRARMQIRKACSCARNTMASFLVVATLINVNLGSDDWMQC